MWVISVVLLENEGILKPGGILTRFIMIYDVYKVIELFTFGLKAVPF